MNSVWFKEGGFAGLGSVSGGSSMCPYVSVRFESDHEAVFDLGKVSILPLDAVPSNATDNAKKRREEWLIRRGPKPMVAGESREVEGVMVHVCAMTAAEVELFSNGWKMRSGYEYIATVDRRIHRLDGRGKVFVDVVENGTRVLLERVMSFHEADGPWSNDTLSYIKRVASAHRKTFESMRHRQA